MVTIKRLGWSSVLNQYGEPDGVGILAIVIKEAGQRPLALLVDLQGRNLGASLTNSAAAATAHIANEADITSDGEWVQLDSMGYFDAMEPSFDGDRARVTWRPIAIEGAQSRSLEAFLLIYGRRGRVAWQALEAAVEEEGVKVTMVDDVNRASDDVKTLHVFSRLIGNDGGAKAGAGVNTMPNVGAH